jgi:hypothetical protein
MRTAEQCLLEAAEMDHAAAISSEPVMVATYEQAAVMWREVACKSLRGTASDPAPTGYRMIRRICACSRHPDAR